MEWSKSDAANGIDFAQLEGLFHKEDEKEKKQLGTTNTLPCSYKQPVCKLKL